MKTININGKDVYIFTDHSNAFVAWGLIYKKRRKPMVLLTLDHHTDIRPAFIVDYYECNKPKVSCANFDRCDHDKYVNGLLDGNLSYKYKLRDLARKLKNDEQIDAAIRAQFISYAFIVTFGENGTPPKKEDNHLFNANTNNCYRLCNNINSGKKRLPHPHTYDKPDNNIFVIGGKECFYVGGQVYSDKHRVSHSNSVIESDYLKCKIEIANEMAKSVGIDNIIGTDYVLDIDLDYFHTKKSISPEDISFMHLLIKNSKAITIATEPRFVKLVRLSGEKITSKFLLIEILKHINDATK